jgi:hypothetical protein
VHPQLSRAVGTCTAAFARCMLAGQTQPGVWFPEERGALADRRALLGMASDGCSRFLLNRTPWQVGAGGAVQADCQASVHTARCERHQARWEEAGFALTPVAPASLGLRGGREPLLRRAEPAAPVSLQLETDPIQLGMGLYI